MPPKILVIDDNSGNRAAVAEVIQSLNEKAEIISASSGGQGIEKAGARFPDTILIDEQMPDKDGFEVCRHIKSDPKVRHIPVIMLTAEENINITDTDSGADAYLPKPPDKQMLAAQIKTALRLKRAEDALGDKRNRPEQMVGRPAREVEKRPEILKKILDASPSFIYVKDLDTRLTLVNRQFTENFGISEQSAIGRTMEEIMPHHAVLARTMRENDMAVLSGAMDRLEAEEQYPDSRGAIRWAHSVKTPLLDKQGRINGLIGFSTDITREKVKAQQQEKLENQLRQAQKMEAIGTLAGGIAHDFNNILSSIIGYTELSLEETEKGSFLEKSMQEVLKGGMRARELVKQILTFSRQAEQEKMPIQIKLLLKEALKLLRASVPATIEIREKIDSDDLVLGDAGQFYQVIMNLCTNAFQAIDDKGGIMCVSLKKEKIDIERQAPLSHPELESGEYIKLSVSDTGHGMDSDIIDKIFDPFFTTKTDGKGSGLGLSVVHGIARSHGGTISVHSKPEKGSTFNVYLPVADTASEDFRTMDNSTPTGTEKVLFVDDETAIVNLAESVLQSMGYRVETRSSSHEALELFKSDPRRFDLVITDLTMPNMTGDELAGHIKETRPDMPIILCTGFSERFSEEDARKLGISAFIMKPIVRTDLARAIRNVLDRK
ncbi:MAG: response regulator [Desulfobacterales bacterium]|nr:response regulator [Desulfobacterales bacterium]